MGADFGPGLAARLGAACITSVEGFRREKDGVVFSRPFLNGKMRMEIVPEAETTVVTLLPGAFRREETRPSPEDQAGRPGETLRPDTLCDRMPTTETGGKGGLAAPETPEVIPVKDLPLKTRPLGLLPAPDEDADLAAAEVIVAAGRGIGGEENLALLRRLASLFSRSALGASRAVCDAGWLPQRLQIGQTGKTVAPRLYIACGISGALQHLAGMRGSQCIVAINRDPRAAIFQAADVAVVEDLVSFLPLLIDACRRRQGIRKRGRFMTDAPLSRKSQIFLLSLLTAIFLPDLPLAGRPGAPPAGDRTGSRSRPYRCGRHFHDDRHRLCDGALRFRIRLVPADAPPDDRHRRRRRRLRLSSDRGKSQPLGDPSRSVFLGVATGIYLPSGMTTITASIPSVHWGKAIAFHELAPAFAFILAPFIVEGLLVFWPWQAILVLIGVISVILGLVFLRFGPGGDFTGRSAHPRQHPSADRETRLLDHGRSVRSGDRLQHRALQHDDRSTWLPNGASKGNWPTC